MNCFFCINFFLDLRNKVNVKIDLVGIIKVFNTEI